MDIVVVDWFHPGSRGYRVFDDKLEAECFRNEMCRRGAMVQVWDLCDPEVEPGLIPRGLT